MDIKPFDYFKIKDYFVEIESKPAILLWGEKQDNKPDVCIAIPTFNRSKTLRESINSAVNQNVNYNYEIIVVDNNPERNDETEIMMMEYRQYSNIRYYKNSENIGMAGNWSRCYQLAEADWVVLLHDDDLLTPDYLSEITKCISNENIDAVFVNMDVFNDGDPVKNIVNPSITKLNKLSLYDWFLFPCITPSGHIIKKQTIFDLGGFSVQNFAPDIFFAKIMAYKNGYMANKTLLHYRKGINESTKFSAMEKMCDLNHDYRLQAWPRMGISPTLLNRALLYSDIMFEAGFRNFWNPEFRYSKIPSHTKWQYYKSKFAYNIVKFGIMLKKRLFRKQIIIK